MYCDKVYYSRIQAQQIKETPRAILFQFGGVLGEKQWFPKSVVKLDSDGITYYVADWFWNANVSPKLEKYKY
jgi:hypothetical protein